MTNLPAELRKHHMLPVSVAVLGVVASFALLLSSTGSNDIRAWERFATAIQTSGLLQLYESDELFNHPPLMGVLAWISLEASSLIGVPFAVVFKLFPDGGRPRSDLEEAPLLGERHRAEPNAPGGCHP